MKFSEHWLRQWVNPSISTQVLSDQLTMAGLEVASVNEACASFSGVVIAKVLSCVPHPKADKLTLCEVSDGVNVVPIVCGAKNVRVGLKTALAQVGAVLPGGIKIKPVSLRGELSKGMLCAESELGLSKDSDGLMELADDATVGQSIRDYLQLEDSIFEFDLTPNRGDCLSIAGFAREVAALNQCSITKPDIQPVTITSSEVYDVSVEDVQACPRYTCRVIREVDLQVKTPLWMTECLRRSDISSVNLVVDVLNYVMVELGQPMHAFDLNALQGSLSIRLAHQNEAIDLLNGQTVMLEPDSLLVVDEKNTLALAGIMGSKIASVGAETKNVLLESAFFSPVCLAGNARHYGLHTDASHRFERGVDPGLQITALERATQLLVDLCGGQPGPIIEKKTNLPKCPQITFKPACIKQRLNITLSEQEIEKIFASLGIKTVSREENQWVVQSPSHRFDLQIEADLIEEIARVYGYDRLPVRTPKMMTPLVEKPEARRSIFSLYQQLVSLDYQQIISYSFVDKTLQKQCDPTADVLTLINPISTDMSVMRTSLWPGLLKTALYNLKRQQSRIRLFETGLVFKAQNSQNDKSVLQKTKLAMLVTGSRFQENWGCDAVESDFFDLKSDLEVLLSSSRCRKDYHFYQAEHPALHPGQAACIDYHDQVVGYMGALHPNLMHLLGFKQPVYLLDIELDLLLNERIPSYFSVSYQPESRRDLALLVEESISFTQIIKTIKESAGDCLVDVTIFDMYTGQDIALYKKSMTLGLTWQHPLRTLTHEEIDGWVSNVINRLKNALNIELRN